MCSFRVACHLIPSPCVNTDMCAPWLFCYHHLNSNPRGVDLEASNSIFYTQDQPSITRMAKKPRPAPKEETRPFFMFPSRHKDVAAAVSHSMTCTWVRKRVSDQEALREYETHVMGNFKCPNTACSPNGWSSKKVAIKIRGYGGNGYNAVVFNQRCKNCNQLGILYLDKESYIDRVAYRIQKWAGVPVEQPVYAQKQTLPHKRELCEGCKRRVCRQAPLGKDL